MQPSRADSSPPAPWESAPAGEPIFAVLWATGDDPRLDRVFRIAALRRGADGWERFDTTVDPFPDREDESASARMVREFGVQRAQLGGAPPLEEAWARFREFCGDSPLITSDAERLEAWHEHLGTAGSSRAACLGLSEMAALLFPGRLALLGAGLVDALCPIARAGPAAAIEPEEVRAALGELVRRFLAQDPRLLRLASGGYARAWFGLAASDPPAAERLAFALALVERPSAWSSGSSDLYLATDLADGALSVFLEDPAGADLLLEGLVPRVTEAFEAWAEAPKLPPSRGLALPFPDEDRRRLDDLFQVHLPALISDELGVRREDAYREAQHAVANRVADALGGSELLLMHAPTGTGKTMAYLLPALLWARRHGVRVGVATFTRALQEQAMDREVPRALAGLARVGYVGGTRVSILKGRENYLCFRSLRLSPPALDDEPEVWLGWTGLALFALTDMDGDLDRFPRRAPIRLTSEKRHRAIVGGLVRGARARSGCCEHRSDRGTCAAELARARAERSHLVLTNQSFALTREEFFRHLIFDECEHLHEVAAGTWSHRTSLRELRNLLERLHRPGRGPARAPLDRLGRQLLPSTPSHDELAGTLLAWERTAFAIEAVEREARHFEQWREDSRRRMNERDEHVLFRRYVEEEEAGEKLVGARLALSTGLGELESALARLAESIDGLPLRGRARLRRNLDLARADLAEHVEAVAAWIPTDAGRARLGRALFHDLERDARGDLELVARVLLPGDVLGRNYYPDLETGVFLSAATKLRGGFDTALAYLGLDRVERGSPEGLDDEASGDETGGGRPVARFSAPEAFDYSRVLVGAPRDVPAPNDKAAYLDWVTRFLLWLGVRTRGRILALFTNLDDVRRVGEALREPFRECRVPLWYQGMEEAGKEELAGRFRARVDSVLLGVDTFWYGADFPGETLEYLVLARLPYGVPDRYHHAQCAVLGAGAQRERIYLPRALAKFRQGFGRLMRRTTDRGCVFVLDRRLTEARHRMFLKELPLEGPHTRGARLVRGDATLVLRESLAHMGMLEDLKRRGLSEHFEDVVARPALPSLPEPDRIDVTGDELPF